MKTWIIIAAYNEGKMIGQVVEQLLGRYPLVIVVDDASGDDTGRVAERAGATVLTHLINRGQGAALKTGMAYALRQGAEIIVTFDADGQHQVDDIAQMIGPIEAGEVEVTLGSRFLQDGTNIPPLRRVVLRLGVLFTRVFSRINVTDTHNGLRAFSALAAKKIRIVQDRMAHASEILDEITRHKLRYKEIPVTILYSYYSKGKGQKNSALFKIAMKFLLSKLTH